MAQTVQYVVPVELRDADDGPRLAGTVLQEGRASAGGRAEVFAPLSVLWPSDGIKLLSEHFGTVLARAVPTRDADGSLRIETPATPEIRAAYETRRYFSIEFQSLKEVKTLGGVREIQRAFMESAALVADPEYVQATAEIRARSSRRVWL